MSENHFTFSLIQTKKYSDISDGVGEFALRRLVNLNSD